MVNPVRSGQGLKPKARQPVIRVRPLDTIGSQRIQGTRHIQQIPSAIAVLPLSSVGVAKISPQRETGDLIIKADRVVADSAGFRVREFLVNPLNECRFGQALFLCLLGRDPRHPDGGGMRQAIRARARIEHQRLVNNFECSVGADAGELPGSILIRVFAGGFVIVPIKRIR